MQTVLFSLVPPIDKTLAFVWSVLSKTLDVPERLCMVDAKVVCFKMVSYERSTLTPHQLL